MLYNFNRGISAFEGYVVKFFVKIRVLFLFLGIVLLSGPVFAKNKGITLRTGIQPMNISRFVMEMSEDTTYKILYLDNPKRVVIDIPEMDVSNVLKDSLKSGFISDVRVGNLDPKTARVVLDLSSYARVKNSFVLKPLGNNKNYRLVLDIESVSKEEFAKLLGHNMEDVIVEEAPKIVVKPVSSTSNTTITTKKTTITTTKKGTKKNIAVKKDNKKTIVIDAGHGGKDPGTIGVGGTYEKVIALSMAKQLRDILAKNPDYRVILTRENDTFIQLQDRAKIAEKENATIFVSIHLNSSPNKQTHGFSIYTLNEKATDDEARKIAEKENAADLLGIGSFEGYDNITKNILGDLLQTQVKIASVELATEMVNQVKQEVACIYQPHREAPFIVLRSSIPSVLIEAGFLSNREEEKKLNQKWYREKMAYSFARAIDKILKN